MLCHRLPPRAVDESPCRVADYRQGFFLCYSSREARPTGPALLLLALGGRWAGAAGSARAPPCFARPVLLRSVQQLRAEMPPTTATSPARAAAAPCRCCGPLRWGPECCFAAAARSPYPAAAADPPGPVMRITGVIRVQRPAAARQLPWQLRITEALLCAELGPGAGPLPVRSVPLGRCRIRSFAAAVCGVRRPGRRDGASAASSREPVQLRCRGSWSEGTGGSR